MNRLHVDHGSLVLAADHLRATVAAMQSRLDELSAQLAPLADQWQGSAQTAFQVARARWDAAMVGLSVALAQAQTAVLTANDEYRAADLRAARAFGG